MRCPNHGFAHANNQALRTCDARYVLLPQPRHRAARGHARRARRRSSTAAPTSASSASASSRPTARSTRRCAGSRASAACSATRSGWSGCRTGPSWLGEREVDPSRYEAEFEGDWTIGSFMLVRREALESAGYFDERFFIYSEEVDFCLRREAGGLEAPLPAGDDDPPPRPEREPRARRRRAVRAAERVLAAAVRAEELPRPTYRAAFRGALLLRYGLRSVAGGDARQRAAARAAADVVLGPRRAAVRGAARRRRSSCAEAERA